MHKVQRISSLRAAVNAARKERKTIGFVPTMGNLHSGHLELVKIARRHADFIVVSIYVNPTQFGADEDLDNYPSTPEEDARALAEVGADLLFLPANEVMYPGEIEDQTVVYVPKMGARYCGEDRPVHFNGVTTVVSRLFNMVQPDVAVFGKKDYQQLAIIRRMVADLAYPVEVVGVETVRDENGLALSSRNGYLSNAELVTGALLQKQLQQLAEKLQSLVSKGPISEKKIRDLEVQTKKNLTSVGFKPHYVTICKQSNLQPAKSSDTKLVILAAAVLGKARLIDNYEFELT